MHVFLHPCVLSRVSIVFLSRRRVCGGSRKTYSRRILRDCDDQRVAEMFLPKLESCCLDSHRLRTRWSIYICCSASKSKPQPMNVSTSRVLLDMSASIDSYESHFQRLQTYSAKINPELCNQRYAPQIVSYRVGMIHAQHLSFNIFQSCISGTFHRHRLANCMLPLLHDNSCRCLFR